MNASTGSARPATVTRHHGLHEALIAAADRTIATDGLGKLRARALAEAAGCSIGAIYTVFPDLDALILAVNGRTLAAIDAVMAAAGDARVVPEHRLVDLALAYLGYASEHRARWDALFLHRLEPGHTLPDWYAAQQAAAFSHIEAPLAALRPDLSAAECAVLARSLFSAVHGMVALGLDEKLAALPLTALRGQIEAVAKAMARGLAHPHP